MIVSDPPVNDVLPLEYPPGPSNLYALPEAEETQGFSRAQIVPVEKLEEKIEGKKPVQLRNKTKQTKKLPEFWRPCGVFWLSNCVFKPYINGGAPIVSYNNIS